MEKREKGLSLHGIIALKMNPQSDSVAKSSGVALNGRNKPHCHGGSITSVLAQATSMGIMYSFHVSRGQEKYWKLRTSERNSYWEDHKCVNKAFFSRHLACI